MERVPHEVVDEQGVPAHAQGFAQEGLQLGGVEMMREKIAAHQIKRIVGKRQSQCVADYGMISAREVGVRKIKESCVERDTFAGGVLPHNIQLFSRARGDVEKGKAAAAGCVGDTHDHLAGSGDASEPAVDLPDGFERSLNFLRGAGIGVENFGSVNPPHGGRTASATSRAFLWTSP